MSRPRYVDPDRVRALVSEGLTVAEVARELSCSRPTVYKALRLARESGPNFHIRDSSALPNLRPRFPRGDFTPSTVCDCDVRPIKPGTPDYCPVCHKSGLDGLKYFATAKPPPKDPPTGKKKKAAKLTRKERRQLQRLVAGMR